MMSSKNYGWKMLSWRHKSHRPRVYWEHPCSWDAILIYVAPTSDLPTEEAEARLKEAEKESLDARAAYLLKENIVKNVVQAGPLLKSIHAGGKASPMERNLHPLIDQRDILSIAQTNLSARHQAATNSLTSTRAENIRALRRNQELATTLLKLVEEVKDAGSESIGDPDFQQELEELKAETRREKKQYRIVKGVVSAIVAGSGYDWSQDEELMGLVLDEED